MNGFSTMKDLMSIDWPFSEYRNGIEHEHEHRDAEHEHEEMPEQSDATEFSVMSRLLNN